MSDAAHLGDLLRLLLQGQEQRFVRAIEEALDERLLDDAEVARWLAITTRTWRAMYQRDSTLRGLGMDIGEEGRRVMRWRKRWLVRHFQRTP